MAYAGLGDPYLPFREVLDLLTGEDEAEACFQRAIDVARKRLA